MSRGDTSTNGDGLTGDDAVPSPIDSPEGEPDGEPGIGPGTPAEPDGEDHGNQARDAGEASRAAPRPNRPVKQVAPSIPTRDSAEGIWSWIQRPGVRDHVSQVTLTPLIPNPDTGRQTKGTPVKLYGAPTVEDALHRIRRPGVYQVTVLREAPDGSGRIMGTEKSWYVHPEDLEPREDDRPEDRRHENDASVLEGFLRETRQELREERDRHTRELAELREQLTQGSRSSASETVELVKALAGSGGGLDFQRAEQIRSAAYEEGRGMGRREGALETRLQAREEAEAELTRERQALDAREKDLDTREAELDERDAEAEDLDAELANREAELQEKARKLDVAQDQMQHRWQHLQDLQRRIANTQARTQPPIPPVAPAPGPRSPRSIFEDVFGSPGPDRDPLDDLIADLGASTDMSDLSPIGWDDGGTGMAPPADGGGDDESVISLRS